MFEVVAMGELLIDFTPDGIRAQGNKTLEVNPGGAPCNVLAILSKLGKKAAFIGKVGKDKFGVMLKQTVDELGINTDNLVFDDNIHTTLAFVHLDEAGDRSFSFCRNPGADMMLTVDEINPEIIKNTKIFHFGSLSMTAPGITNTTKKAVEIAQEAGVLISFDPNLRPPLWGDLEDAKKAIEYGLSVSDIVKISEEELEFITGESDITKAVEAVKAKFGNIKLIFATMGKEGSSFYYKDITGFKSTFTGVKTIDTTGAGDTFCGSMLSAIIDNGLDNLSFDTLMEMLTFANAAASLVTTKKGALKSMPNKHEILELINI